MWERRGAACVMRAVLTGKIPGGLRSRLARHRRSAAASSELASTDHFPGFLPHLADALSRRAYRGTSIAMASGFQPELARRPPSVPPPEAPNGGKVRFLMKSCQLGFDFFHLQSRF
jgi:hypothetical protein